MKSKNPAIREWGQRSLSSTFFRTPSTSSNDSAQATPVKSSNMGSHISLSDFLDRRLHKASVLPRTVQGKERPFSSSLGCSNEIGSILRHAGVKKTEDKESNVIDVQVFKQLKHTREENEDFIGSCGFDEIGSFHSDTMPKSRKRKGPSVDGGVARKHLVVLGDDPKPKRNKRPVNFIGDERPRPQFNYYANGSGWWDCNMEGVDGDEVGFNQAWEGVGSTTLGGMEWH